MSCLGVYFSLSDEEVEALRRLEEGARWGHIVNVVEPDYFGRHRERMAESDKSWDLMHRALGDGTLNPDGGTYPLTHVVLGGESLHVGEDYILRLKTPDQVRDVAAALPEVTADLFRACCKTIDSQAFGYVPSDEEIDGTYEWFEGVRTFWLAAARERRFILFTADQ